MMMYAEFGVSIFPDILPFLLDNFKQQILID